MSSDTEQNSMIGGDYYNKFSMKTKTNRHTIPNTIDLQIKEPAVPDQGEAIMIQQPLPLNLSSNRNSSKRKRNTSYTNI